jgi:hypothetical protein
MSDVLIAPLLVDHDGLSWIPSAMDALLRPSSGSAAAGAREAHSSFERRSAGVLPV